MSQVMVAACLSTGATVVDEQVVIDGNLITSRQPNNLDAFARGAEGARARTQVVRQADQAREHRARSRSAS